MEILLTAEMAQTVLENQRLVHHLLKKIDVAPRDYEDLFQTGMIGLMKAVATFDKSKNIQFSSYASKCINNEINMFFRKNSRHLGVLSLNQEISDTTDNGELTLQDTLIDLTSSHFTDKIENQQILENAIRTMFNCFFIDKTIILLFLTAGLPQKDIAMQIGIPEQRLSKMKNKLHQRLKKHLYSSNKLLQEKVSVSIRNGRIKIVFFTGDKESFTKAFIKVLSFEEQNNFKILSTNGQVTMSFLAEPENFECLAKILLEVQKYDKEFA